MSAYIRAIWPLAARRAARTIGSSTPERARELAHMAGEFRGRVFEEFERDHRLHQPAPGPRVGDQRRDLGRIERFDRGDVEVDAHHVLRNLGDDLALQLGRIPDHRESADHPPSEEQAFLGGQRHPPAELDLGH